jgi:hypothetical protein
MVVARTMVDRSLADELRAACNPSLSNLAAGARRENRKSENPRGIAGIDVDLIGLRGRASRSNPILRNSRDIVITPESDLNHADVVGTHHAIPVRRSLTSPSVASWRTSLSLRGQSFATAF